MSVMQLSAQSFKKNVLGISQFSGKYNYGRVILSSDITPTFEILQAMNTKSFSVRYKDSSNLIPFKNLAITEKHKSMSSLLKSLQCLLYNIEIEVKDMSYDEKEAMKTLTNHIDAIKSYLINQLEEYKEAQWG